MPLGCLIKGETPHFQFLADAVANGLMQISLAYPTAITFGVITCDTAAQARERSGGRMGNKGAEAMDAALGMFALRERVLRSPGSRR